MRFLRKLKEYGYALLFGIASLVIMAAINLVFKIVPLPVELTIEPGWPVILLGVVMLFHLPKYVEKMDGVIYSDDILGYWIRFGILSLTFVILSLIIWASMALSKVIHL